MQRKFWRKVDQVIQEPEVAIFLESKANFQRHLNIYIKITVSLRYGLGCDVVGADLFLVVLTIESKRRKAGEVEDDLRDKIAVECPFNKAQHLIDWLRNPKLESALLDIHLCGSESCELDARGSGEIIREREVGRAFFQFADEVESLMPQLDREYNERKETSHFSNKKASSL